MKIFIDTANLKEIQEAASMGLVDGVTTNPSLIAKEGRPFREIIREICEVVNGPISAEVIASEAPGMIREARQLAQIHPNIVAKIPLTAEGLKATRALEQEKIRCNVTLVFSPNQALLAAKAGASFVSPFIGRLDDIGQKGMDLIEQVLTIYENYDFATEVIVASVRHPMHVVEAALLGAHICTIPYKVIMQLARHPLTDKGIAQFLSDWNQAGASLT